MLNTCLEHVRAENMINTEYRLFWPVKHQFVLNCFNLYHKFRLSSSCIPVLQAAPYLFQLLGALNHVGRTQWYLRIEGHQTQFARYALTSQNSTSAATYSDDGFQQPVIDNSVPLCWFCSWWLFVSSWWSRKWFHSFSVRSSARPIRKVIIDGILSLRAIYPGPRRPPSTFWRDLFQKDRRNTWVVS